ncbi:MAG: leucyl aminopeptidase [Syntrophobacterales bacterium]|nr:MAG: leucyl aminopeptidase [Syntrophobacterales bacterium]
MKIILQRGRLESFTSEAVVAFHFEGDEKLLRDTEAMNKASGGLISGVIQSGDFQGELYQPSLIYTKGTIPSTRILLMGLGKRSDFHLDKWRGAASKAAQFLRDKGVKEFSLYPYLSGERKISLEDFSQGLIEGIYLGLYRFTEFKTEEMEKIKKVEQVHLVTPDERGISRIQKTVDTAEAISQAVYLARDLVSRPANRKTPSMLAQIAKEVAENTGLRCEVLNVDEMKKLGMGALLAVASGSREPPKFIILEYKPPSNSLGRVVVIGKAITFDSGGLSLKPSENMDKMKHDMGGGAAAIGILRAASQLKLPFQLIALIPATENLPSGSAYRPGDILTSLSGKTIEVISTDAEGRLILADALAYSQRFKPKAIIDLATLTGACIIALGENVTGMMGNDDELKARVRRAADRTGEKVWELPLWEEYGEQIKSEVADIKNVGGRPAGTITGGAFLKKFVGEYPWVHLDIAGPVWADKDKPYIPKGATGVGVRLVVQLLREWKVSS